ncbi:MAG TPA: hypothetical protein VH878_05295, partial [Thermodesulfobacteriota bacterium]
MEELLNKILSVLETIKEELGGISSTANSNAKLIKANRELLDRNHRQPLQNAGIIKQNRDFINRNKKLIEQNGRALKEVLTRLKRIESKAGAPARKSR